MYSEQKGYCKRASVPGEDGELAAGGERVLFALGELGAEYLGQTGLELNEWTRKC